MTGAKKTSGKLSAKPLVGFIGQGWIGKHYADDMEHRGYTVVRYSLEKPYIKNKAKIQTCDIVFIAVPTPTTPKKGFDDSIVRAAIGLVGRGKTAVIKSTLIPGTTELIQKQNPDVFVLNSPEFLSVGTAAHDASNPVRNIVGIPTSSKEYKEKAEQVMSVLPKARFSIVCTAREAEIIKYGRNILGYFRVILTNMFYDLSKSLNADWEPIKAAMSADEFNGPRYMTVNDQKGRGAGGGCFIKDFPAFKRVYEKIGDPEGLKVLEAIEQKNIELLLSTGKDIDLLKGVYGDEIIDPHPKSR